MAKSQLHEAIVALLTAGYELDDDLHMHARMATELEKLFLKAKSDLHGEIVALLTLSYQLDDEDLPMHATIAKKLEKLMKALHEPETDE